MAHSRARTRRTSPLGCRVAVLAAAALGAAAQQQSLLSPPANLTGSDFGHSVALSAAGDVAVVGAHLTNTSAGAVFVFRREGAGWSRDAMLTAGDAAPRSSFGRAVAISSDSARVVVGASETDSTAPVVTSAGAAYIFARLASGGWVQETKLEPREFVESGRYAMAVAIQGTWVLIGSPRLGDDGEVEIWRLDDDNGWVRDRTLVPPIPQPPGSTRRSNFGQVVSLDGSRVVIGRPNDDALGIALGSVVVYDLADASTHVLHPREVDRDMTSEVGSAVAISGDRIVASTIFVGVPFGNAGAVFPFSWNGTAWVAEPRLQPASIGQSAYFGTSVALSGGRLLVGSLWPSRVGRVTMFLHRDGVWVEEFELESPDAQISTWFGQSVALGGDNQIAVIGEPYSGDLGRVVALEWLGAVEAPPVVVSPLFGAAFELAFAVTSTFSSSQLVEITSQAGVVSPRAVELAPGTNELVLALDLAPGQTAVVEFARFFAPVAGAISVSVEACKDTGQLWVSDPNDPYTCTCGAGAFASRGTLCFPCGVGTYKDFSGPDPCLPCPQFLTTAAEGATSRADCTCADGTYLSDGLCLSCPDGAECVGGTVAALPGHWLEFDGEGQPVIWRCDLSGICKFNNTCASGYTGIVCGACESGYGRAGELCLPCPPQVANGVLVALVLLIGVAVLVALVASSQTPGSKIATGLKVVLNYVQVLGLFAQLSAGWPRVVAGALGLAGALTPTSQTMSLSCAFGSDPHDRFLAALLIPCLTGAVLLAVLGVHERRGWRAERRVRAYAYASFFLFLIHPSVTQSTLSVLLCRSFGRAGSFLASDLSVSCDTSRHTVFLALGIVWLLVYCVGLLVAAAAALRRKSGRANTVLLFLRSGYHPEFQSYWEIGPIMGRKLAIMMCATLVPAGSAQLFLGTLVLLLALLANSRFRPFESSSVSNLEDASLVTLLVTLSAAVAFRDPETGQTYESTLAWFVLITNAAFLVAFAGFVARRLQRDGVGPKQLGRLGLALRGSTATSTETGSVGDDGAAVL